MSLYPRPKVIYVDVDGTLTQSVVAWCRARKVDGFGLVLWSSRGEQHAKAAADAMKCAEIFDHIVSKPGYIVDDKGWEWAKYTKVVRALK